MQWNGPWAPAAYVRDWVTVVVCQGTGQVLNCPEIADAYNLDPLKQVQMAAIQQERPWKFPGYTYSSDSDAEDYGQDRKQPPIEAILADTQPRCPRYFDSSCRDVLFDWCPNFKLRYLWCVCKDHCDEAYGEGCAARSAERSWVREWRECREMAAMDENAAASAADSQASPHADT